MTTIDFICIGPLVKTPLPRVLEFEVLHCIGDENRLALDACISQGLGQNAACRTDEWSPLLLFLVPGCSPTIISRARAGPSPDTTWMACL